ncbi:MAG: S-layer homology domain-containing protein [Cyanobacteria bacterium P01_H01_bin.74]
MANLQKQKIKQYTLNLALGLGVSLLPLTAMAAMFVDIQSNWANGAIEKLSSAGVISGYPNGTFRPNGSVTRAEFSAVLAKALDLKMTPSGEQTFSDVMTSNWAYPAIETVRKTGLVRGYPSGEFMPNKSITRAEAMAVLSNAARIPMPSNQQVDQILAAYADSAMIPDWARTGIAASISAQIFANNPEAGKTIEPLQPATRAEVAVMVDNLRSRIAMQGDIAANPTAESNKKALQARIATIPANTKFTGTLNQGMLSSETNKIGDEIELTVNQPLSSADNLTIIPVGSKIMGKIVELKPAGRVGKAGLMDIDFNEIVTPGGQRYMIEGSIATDDGMLHGDDTKGRILKAAGKTGLGAAIGAAAGTAIAPLSGGKVGKGAVYGTAIGGGAGAVVAAVQKGKAVEISAGQQLEIKLDQPITVQVSQ